MDSSSGTTTPPTQLNRLSHVDAADLSTPTQHTNDKIKYESLPITLTQPKLNLPTNKLHDIIQSINPYVTLDSDVQNIISELGNDFIHSVANAACKLAKHRNVCNTHYFITVGKYITNITVYYALHFTTVNYTGY